MKRPLLVALAISTGVHAAVLTALLATRSSSRPSSPMRVRVLGARAPSPETPPAEQGGAPSSPPPSSTSRAVSDRLKLLAAPASARNATATAPPSTATPERAPAGVRPARGETPARTAEGTPEAPIRSRAVQDDIWVLTDDAPAEGVPAPGSPTEPEGALSPDPSSGTGRSGPPSLVGELSRRLAWSAARCAPSGAVRSSRGEAPEVPLHFCLDASGRPSAVGLEGTTGSELLDRAARECVVPGAVPLPALPGCYTVAVRFPVRQ